MLDELKTWCFENHGRQVEAVRYLDLPRQALVYCRIPADSVVGAGAVVTKDFSKEGTGLLLAGNPAEVRKRQGKVL